MSRSVEDPIEVNDVAELLPHVELKAVRTYRISAMRYEDGAEHKASDEMELLGRSDSSEIEVRVRHSHSTEAAMLVADIGAIFKKEPRVRASEAAISDFAEKVGIMTVIPYLREAISTSAARLGVPVPLLQLIRAGQIRVTPADSSEGDGSTSDADPNLSE